MELSEKKQKILVFLCWLMYSAAYCGRYGYNANINFVISDFGVTHAEAGLVATLFFFAYGAGQVVNGILCRYYNKRYVLGGAMAISAVINLAVFAGAGFASWKYLWLINGFVQSVLWSSLVLVLGENLSSHNFEKAVFAMSTTTAAGTFLSYGCSALFALWGGYKYTFLFGGVLLAAVGAVWTAFYGSVTLKSSRGGQKTPVSERQNTERALRRGIFVVAAVLAVFAVANNLIKDGLTTWAPSILKENYGVSDSLSIFITLFLPVLGVFGATFAVLLNRKVKNLVFLSAALFVFVFALSLAVALCSKSMPVVVASACFVLVSCLTSAVNNVITSIAPFYYKDKLNPGALSGVLNGFCYVGSTISSYGLGAVSDRYGWSGVFVLFSVLSGVLAVIGGAFSAAGLFGKRRKKLTAEGKDIGGAEKRLDENAACEEQGTNRAEEEK